MALNRELRSARRDPQRLDSLALYNALKDRSAGPFISEVDLQVVMEKFRTGISSAASADSTLYGFRAQNLFRGVALSLDSIDFIKDEDQGLVHFRGPDVKAPDFRVRTETGEVLLIEVKNTRPTKWTDSFSVSIGELKALRRFGEISGGGRVMVAVYWVWWNLWTLFDLDVFTLSSRRASIDLPTAAKHNKMAMLGDRTLGTEVPLALTVFADLGAPRSSGEDGRVNFTIERAEYSVAGRSIESAMEQKIAHTLMLFGGWTDERTIVEEDEGGVASARFELRPEVLPAQEQGFALHAPLSSIFSSYFNLATLDEDGAIQELDAAHSAMALGSLVSEPYSGKTLHLWRFTMNPEDGET